MTNTACLPECERNCWTGQDKHAFGCPVAAMFGSAEQAYFGPRAPQAKVVCICSPNCFGCECNCHYSIRPAPQAEDGGKVHGDDCVDDCNGCTCWCHPKPAPAPEPKCRTHCRPERGIHTSGCPRRSAPEPKQGSEEPIDWDAAKASSESWAKGRPLPHDLKCTPAQETLGRAYVALRTEVENWRNESLPAKLIDALRTENERLYGKVQGHGLVLAERDSLRAEVAKLRKFVSEAMHEADAEKARADKAEERVIEAFDEAAKAVCPGCGRRALQYITEASGPNSAHNWTHDRVDGEGNPMLCAASAIHSLRARQEQKEGGR